MRLVYITVNDILSRLAKEHSIDQVSIISDERVLYSGSVKALMSLASDMMMFKAEFEHYTVIKVMKYNERKAFVFV